MVHCDFVYLDEGSVQYSAAYHLAAALEQFTIKWLTYHINGANGSGAVAVVIVVGCIASNGLLVPVWSAVEFVMILSPKQEIGNKDLIVAGGKQTCVALLIILNQFQLLF